MRTNRIFSLATLLVAGALVLAACGTEASQSPADAQPTSTPPQATAGGVQSGDTQQLTITAKDNMFDPTSYQATAGKPIHLTVVNAGQNVHEVEVKGLTSETKVSAGSSFTVDIPAQQAGTFKIYCEIHEDTGMEGELVVK